MDDPFFIAEVWVHLPAHRGLDRGLSYRHTQALDVGQLVRVHVGTTAHLGIVAACTPAPMQPDRQPAHELKPVDEVLQACPPLSSEWLKLIEFTAQYYRRSPGEVAAMALPTLLKQSTNASLEKRKKKGKSGGPTDAIAPAESASKTLSPEQQQALQTLLCHTGTSLLYGATGSGKTEVYLRHIQQVLDHDPQAQVLVMVPEINLTPQLEQQVRERFHGLGAWAVVSLHSGLTPAQRLNHWLNAHEGHARIVLGTRLSVFASLPQLKLIVVDEEHDPSFKQGDGPRHSARDLAVFRGHQLGIPVVLASATPSLESWNNSAPERKSGYVRICMPSRQGNLPMPELVLVDMNRFSRNTGLSKSLEHAIKARIDASEQVLLLLNRRGYSPVLYCPDCQWTSDCPHCSAHQVLHKADRRLHCHHCGEQAMAPRSCPACGGLQILGLGQGTEQIEEELIHRMSGWRKPNGEPVTLMRMDADTVRLKGQLTSQLHAFHQGHADVLIGTQMVAKGHDFRRVGLVAALNPDGGLFSSDFRAPERLFALLMQAAGRAGRDPQRPDALPAQMWIQTHHPEHHLFKHLRHSDYAGFAQDELAARHSIGLPPFVHQALLRTESRKAEPALEALNRQHQLCEELAQAGSGELTVHHPVPMSMGKLAGVHRAQLLIESPSRKTLQSFLQAWDEKAVTKLRQEKGLLRWAWDIDPASI
jgi:primosomal protein N' (replication factor Y)